MVALLGLLAVRAQPVTHAGMEPGSSLSDTSRPSPIVGDSHAPPASLDPLQAFDPWKVPHLGKGKDKNKGKNDGQVSNADSAQTIQYITIEKVVEVPAAKPLTSEASTYTTAEIFAGQADLGSGCAEGQAPLTALAQGASASASGVDCFDESTHIVEEGTDAEHKRIDTVQSKAFLLHWEDCPLHTGQCNCESRLLESCRSMFAAWMRTWTRMTVNVGPDDLTVLAASCC